MSSLGLTLLVYGRFVEDGSFQMFCSDCDLSIEGTISLGLLREAIMHNAHRGGIKCPNCRKNCCAVCGLAGPHDWLGIIGSNGKTTPAVYVCRLCVLEGGLEKPPPLASTHSLSSITISQN